MKKKNDGRAQREIDEIKERLLKELGMNPPKESSAKPTISKEQAKFNLVIRGVNPRFANLVTQLVFFGKKIQTAVVSTAKNIYRSARTYKVKLIKKFNPIEPLKKITTIVKSQNLRRFIPSRPRFINMKYVLIGIVALIGLIVFFGLIKFDLVKVAQGIETSRGPAGSKTFLVFKTNDLEQNDLIVAKVSGLPSDADMIVGTIFSQNEEFYAFYDGKVIWQVARANVIGKVLLAEARQKP